ncbi:MAG: TonB-dependent receptor, partial [Cyclobacteriaceae bacterium]|nr:TonB-dependent receptor [Cyclobacteriaceae bacterium]
MNQIYILISILLAISHCSYSQGILEGQVTSSDGPLSFVNIGVLGYNIGTFSNEQGKFHLENIPLGQREVLFSFVGFKPHTALLEFKSGKEQFIDIVLEKSFKELEEVVITGTRTERKKTDSPVAVGVIDKKSLENIQANTLADGLNFQSGLRMETDCQTCGYSQLRMNGLGGAYSQILIDSRPIFSSLMGLYGLEQIPVNMIERIEVVRGGGSAVYGSSAIAGTVNVITKEPTSDFLNINLSGGVINNQSFESSINASVSKVYDRAGITLNANRNDREAYDANNDGYSELPKLEGNNFGLNTYYKVGKYSTLGFNLSSIYEYRRGGNKIEEPAHKAEQAEERSHNILMGGLNFKSSMPNLNSSASFYVAGQKTTRKHYTGIDHADAYGNTLGQTFMGGFQYNYFSKSHTLTIGSEYLYDFINDEIQLYNYLINQTTNQIGIYAQEDWEINSKFTLLAGVRMDKHNLVDYPVFNPRVNLLYKPFDFTQIRASYSSGFRAPQAFDTDLHIAFAGGGISLIKLDPNLKEET